MPRKKGNEEEITVESEEVLDPESLNQLALAEEEERISLFMSQLKGAEGEDLKLLLHRSHIKNPAIFGAYIKQYPKETEFIDIQEEARDKYGGGNFVLLLKRGNRIVTKTHFSTVEPEKENIPDKPKELNMAEVMGKLTQSVESGVILQRAQELLNPKSSTENKDGMTAIILAMMQQQTQMFTLLMQKKEIPQEPKMDVVEILKIGMNMALGKSPDAEEDNSILGMLKPILPDLVKIIPSILATRGTGGSVPVNAVRPNLPVRPAIAPAPAVPIVEFPPALPPGFVRIVEEVKYYINSDVTEPIVIHLMDYMDNHMPGSVDELLSYPEEQYLGYVLNMNQEFKDKTEWFKKFRDFALELNKQNKEEGGNVNGAE